ncbi:hypothetical protein SAMN05421831_10752 [Allopseudospirillum japonicum]|uniref:Uncharacterized protein n=1 Tax=Allopseudospirillum japonicum TaxID=64971 RepID=A0A1H6SNI2_9GAMM|nr:hypothetical protein [Allopseudospirillum japonicum]SEI67474.1 hypothetical protein SAMN05421831_10752 [Allopseudospirillum japonicum]
MSEIDSKALMSLLSKESGSDATDLLKQLISSAITEKKSVATPEKLLELYERYSQQHIFKKGDLVRWKSGFKDRKLPLEGEPAVVIEVCENPIFDSQDDAGSHYFREPYDIRLGVLQSDGTFTAYYYNSHRFEPYSK